MGTDDNFSTELPNLLINSLPYFISRSRSIVVNCHDDFCRDHRNYHRSIYHREDRRSEETRRKEDFSFFAFISFFSFHEVRWIHFISNGSTTGPEYLEPTEAHYLWGCELTRKNSTHAIKFPMDADPENESHTLVFKSAALGINAEEKERNIVEIHYFDREEKEVRQVLTTLTLGVGDFRRLDLRTALMDGRDITLKLIKGSGPVSLLGNHVVESFVNVDAEEEDEDFTPGDSTAEGETTDASGMETEGDEVEADEVKDLTEDAKEVVKAEKSRQAKK